MARIDYSFRGPAKALHLDCRVKDFWEEKTKTFCFSEEIRIPWRFDYTLRTRVSVFPYPVSLNPAHSQFTINKSEAGQSKDIDFSIGHERLALEIRLSKSDESFINEALPLRQTHTGKVCIAWEHFIQSYRIDLLTVFDPPSAGPPSGSARMVSSVLSWRTAKSWKATIAFWAIQKATFLQPASPACRLASADSPSPPAKSG